LRPFALICVVFIVSRSKKEKAGRSKPTGLLFAIA